MWGLVILLTSSAIFAASAQDAELPPDLGKMLSEAALKVAETLKEQKSNPDAKMSVVPVLVTLKDKNLKSVEIIRRSKAKIPLPVYVTSSPLLVKEQPGGNRKHSRKLEIDLDGIPVIEGVRMPDDESDRQVWRNARVINGKLFPKKDSMVILPPEQVVRSGFPEPTSERTARSNVEPVSTDQIQARILFPDQLSNSTSPGFYPVASYPYTQAAASSDGVRSPVRQYLHPDFGPQTARTPQYVSTHKPVFFVRDNPQDIHDDRNPYGFEPASLTQQASTVSLKTANPKKTLSHLYQQAMDAYTTKYKRQPYTYNGYAYGKYPYNYKTATANGYTPQRYASYASPVPYGDYHNKYALKKSQAVRQQDSLYYQKQKPFWERIGDKIREHFQSSMNTMTDFTRPVVQPIMEASKRITHNLGFSRDMKEASDKIGTVAGTTSLVLPALGLVAGGAALGLGAVAVGRYLDDNTKRSSSQLKDADEHSIRRRSLDPDVQEQEYFQNILHSLEVNQDALLGHLQRYGNDGWKETPCAKKIFCDVMVQQPSDAISLMEKKMATFLSLIHPDLSAALSHHLNDVMAAVRNHDCSPFYCSTNSHKLQGRAVGPAPR